MHCFSGAYICNIEYLYGKTLHICSIYFLWDGVIVLKGHRIILYMWLSTGSQQPTVPGQENHKHSFLFPTGHPICVINIQSICNSCFFSFFLLFLDYLIKKFILIFISVYMCACFIFIFSVKNRRSLNVWCYVLIFLNNSFSYLYKNEIQAIDREAFKGLVSLEQL